MSLLITFYEGTESDHKGRYLSDILGWNASKLESAHDYIQIVFPLPEASGVQWNAPTINRQVFDAFRARPELRDRLRDSFKKILWFYGFEVIEGDDGVKVRKDLNSVHVFRHWDVRFDHNHLRITRIIRCLRVLGLEIEAQAFYAALKENARRVSTRSQEYWRRAAERTLNLRPDLEEGDIDGDDDLSIGQKFLREFEELQKHIAQSKKAADGVGGEVAAEMADGGKVAQKEDREEKVAGEKEVEMTDASAKHATTMESALQGITDDRKDASHEADEPLGGRSALVFSEPGDVSKVSEKLATAE